MDGNSIAKILEMNGITIKSKTSKSVIAMVDGNRLQKMTDVVKILSKLGAVVDSNLKGSSIGGIRVGDVKILLKSKGRTGGLDVEEAAIRTLSDALLSAMAENGGPITVKLKTKNIKGIAQVIKTAGTPKSDFHLADIKGKPLIHISHKKGSSPRDFQQWGGVTEKEIAVDPEVLDFQNACIAEYTKYDSVIPSGDSAYRIIKSEPLAMMSIFGVKYKSGSTNPNRVDVLIQGDPGLKKKSKGIFELTATGHLHYHGDIPDGDFAPVLAIIYKGDRSQFGIKGARVSIYPKGGRTFKRKL